MAQKGGLTEAALSEIRKGYEGTATDKALRNAMNNASLPVLAKNAERSVMIDTHFSDMVKTKGRTNQKQSGRCWLFTGLNVLRASTIDRFDLGDFQFSQNYCFFYDQLEKANLFLQAVIDTREKPFEDRTVDCLSVGNPAPSGWPETARGRQEGRSAADEGGYAEGGLSHPGPHPGRSSDRVRVDPP